MKRLALVVAIACASVACDGEFTIGAVAVRRASTSRQHLDQQLGQHRQHRR